MLRHDPLVRLILMTAYHRLLPAKPREEDDLSNCGRVPRGVCDRWEERFRE